MCFVFSFYFVWFYVLEKRSVRAILYTVAPNWVNLLWNQIVCKHFDSLALICSVHIAHRILMLLVQVYVYICVYVLYVCLVSFDMARKRNEYTHFYHYTIFEYCELNCFRFADETKGIRHFRASINRIAFGLISMMLNIECSL